jgi:glycosyltransferase involved in cell wall biosynthesis
VRVLIDYRPALRERSGAGEYTHQLVRRLAANPAVELTVFSSSWKDRLEKVDGVAAAAIVDRWVPVSALNLAWHRLGWPPAELLTGRGFDVTHSSHPLILPSRRAARVVTIHDLNFLDHPERTRAEVRRDYGALAPRHARRADAIVVPSRFTAGEVVRRLGVEAQKVAVCPVGAPDWTPRGPARAADGDYLLFVGTLEPRKNVGGLLDAYERLIGDPHLASVPPLVLAGKATDAAAPWLDRIGRAPLEGRVRHIGYVEPSRTRELYAAARLLVLASFEEGFGIPVLEAMTAGVPVVAARRGSLPEVLGDAGQLVEPDRPAEIAAAITRVLEDSSFAAACVERGIARARLFRWDTTADRVVDAYRQAIEAHAHRH